MGWSAKEFLEEKMTKADFTKELANSLNLPLREARLVLDAILDGMVRALHDGERIEIRGFGTFSTRLRGARKARNPSTGEDLQVPQKRIPNFRPSAELKALINASDDQESGSKEASHTYAAV